jgi:hypothetical protein
MHGKHLKYLQNNTVSWASCRLRVRNEPQHGTDHYICWGSQVHPNLQLPAYPVMPPEHRSIYRE